MDNCVITFIIVAFTVVLYLMVGVFVAELLFHVQDFDITYIFSTFIWPGLLIALFLRLLSIVPIKLANKILERMDKK